MSDRQYWLESMLKIVHPVLDSLAQRRLRERMPVEQKDPSFGRESYSHLEALGRTLLGIAPWLALDCDEGKEGELRRTYALLAQQAIDAATDPDSPDYLKFSGGGQPIVDAAFLAHAIIRAPKVLWEPLNERVKNNFVAALKSTRKDCKPGFNNWLLFSAMIETALCVMGEEWDHMRVDYAIMQHRQWYCGDGAYSDGIDFHWDYYNSFVIQPMLVDILRTVGHYYPEWSRFEKTAIERMQRYAVVLERMISPEGTYPAIGRSLAYRFGVFQALSQIVLMHSLPETIAPSQVRCALSAVIRRIMESDGNFDQNGWLKIGIHGSQPSLGEPYISTGSLYLCTAVFLPLGLPEQDAFWSDADQPWTTKRIWMGMDVPADHAEAPKGICL